LTAVIFDQIVFKKNKKIVPSAVCLKPLFWKLACWWEAPPLAQDNQQAKRSGSHSQTKRRQRGPPNI